MQTSKEILKELNRFILTSKEYDTHAIYNLCKDFIQVMDIERGQSKLEQPKLEVENFLKLYPIGTKFTAMDNMVYTIYKIDTSNKAYKAVWVNWDMDNIGIAFSISDCVDCFNRKFWNVVK